MDVYDGYDYEEIEELVKEEIELRKVAKKRKSRSIESQTNPVM